MDADEEEVTLPSVAPSRTSGFDLKTLLLAPLAAIFYYFFIRDWSELQKKAQLSIKCNGCLSGEGTSRTESKEYTSMP